MKRPFKYLILGIGIGLIVSSLFSGMNVKTEKIDTVDDFINPESIVNNSIADDNNKNVAIMDGSEENDPEEVCEYVDVSIPTGIGSHNVAVLLSELGLIENIKDFEDRIAELELDKKIRAGEFRVKKGSDLDRIIAIITGRKDI
ncbi:MAG: hypothetical protein HPY66_0279 [Firmicutes bacterium]|nr:hypothetical protein [Bacillota bacterium]MDI6704701.1 hypothetical protein [Bacillota bacterium]